MATLEWLVDGVRENVLLELFEEKGPEGAETAALAHRLTRLRHRHRRHLSKLFGEVSLEGRPASCQEQTPEAGILGRFTRGVEVDDIIIVPLQIWLRKPLPLSTASIVKMCSGGIVRSRVLLMTSRAIVTPFFRRGGTPRSRTLCRTSILNQSR